MEVKLTACYPPTDPSYLSGGANFQWCPGNMNAFNLLATNYVQAGCIYPYVNTMNLYKCAANQSFNQVGPNLFPHVRSYSMNCYLSPIVGPPSDAWPSIGTRNFFKDAEITQPGPSMTYVLIDENEHSINDAFFVCDPTKPNHWVDVPATRHGNTGGLSYADGHSEIKGWKDNTVLHPPPSYQDFAGDPNSGDSAWLEQRATSVTP